MKRNLLLLLLCTLTCSTLWAKPTKSEEVREIIHKVNSYWQTNNVPQKTFFWHAAAYHTGNMEAYYLTGKKEYLDYSIAWAEHNKWCGSVGNDKSKWVYNYGETPNHALFGDNQICFQTYADIYGIYGDKKMIKRAIEVMEYQMNTPKNDYWWWSDGLYMVMPVMTKMYKATNNDKYLDKLYEYFLYADSIMFDKDENLYYRDARYVYPKHKSANGKKDFWARGDGWVLAGFAKVLQDLPQDYKHRKFFEDRFKAMSKAVMSIQQKGGYWSRSMMDEACAPGGESSGTSFFMYGLMWGVNNGLLDKATYMPCIERAWKFLSKSALQESGKVGYVQPIGERAIPGQVVNTESTHDFGVGAFLLAACEYTRYLEAPTQVDRNYWSEQAYKMAEPVLRNMAAGTL
ncbi:MAG: glycoside hydrolase family 88 protein, partial [Rikenellaceae bacterium]